MIIDLLEYMYCIDIQFPVGPLKYRIGTAMFTPPQARIRLQPAGEQVNVQWKISALAEFRLTQTVVHAVSLLPLSFNVFCS